MKTSAAFEIKYHQFLDAQGSPTTNPLPPPADDPAELLALYRLMTLTRRFDAKAVALQRTGKLGTYASSLGHEAIHVGAASAMTPEDVFAPMYREHGAMLHRGVKMTEILAYWGGDERGSDFSVPRHDFPICVPIATLALYTAGAALAMKLRGERRCALTIVGDGATSKGDFMEALNAAGVWRLPAVFVIANNQWAISMPRSRQSGGRTLAQKGIAAGLPSVQVDGNDLLAVRWAVDTALSRARDGGGASVIECLTYRLSDHTTADDAGRYRSDEEVEAARAEEPLIRLRRFLEAREEWDEERERALEVECTEQVEAATAEYLAQSPQPVTAIFDHMYAELPHDLAEQRAYALEVDHG